MKLETVYYVTSAVLLALASGLAAREALADEESETSCEGKSCSSDIDYFLSALTQDELVKPCEDFKKFALGSLIKNEEDVNDFYTDVADAYKSKWKKFLTEEINGNDTRLTTAVKKFYSGCVGSEELKQNTVAEYVRSLKLKLYPETDQTDFLLSKYFEEHPTLSFIILLNRELKRTQDGQLRLENHYLGYTRGTDDEWLYDGLQIDRNTSEQVKEDLSAIARKHRELYDAQQSISANSSPETAVASMSIAELNSLTSKLNLDWSKLINSQLLTKIGEDEKILVDNPEALRNISNFLASTDKKSIADFVAYFWILMKDEFAIRCDHVIRNLSPVQALLYSYKYRDEMLQNSLEGFINQMKDFSIQTIQTKSQRNETITEDLMDRIRSIKVIAGYPEKYLQPLKMFDELYSNFLSVETPNLLAIYIATHVDNKKLSLEPKGSEIGELRKYAEFSNLSFLYSPFNDTLFIHFGLQQSPFYHYLRPRSLNSATVGYYFLQSLNNSFRVYLSRKYGDPGSSNVFDDELQIAYEHFDEWLKSGGTEPQLRTNRGISDRQLFWIASARVFYDKNYEKFVDPEGYKGFHQHFASKPGIREVFQCEN